MILSEKNLSIIIVTFKSEKIIDDCLKLIDEKYSVNVIENSNETRFKNYLENKYKNVTCHLSGSNIGMGSANNIGLKFAKTDYALIINPDVRLENETLDNLFLDLKKIEDFAIASPIETSDKKKNNYGSFKNKKIVASPDTPFNVDYVDGFAMLINKTKFQDNKFFDEEYFMYLENNDLCKRIIDNNEKIYILPNSKIVHLGAKTSDEKFSKDIEMSRNWHWMWSTFYFNKKHYGFMYALIKSSKNFISSIIKMIYYMLTFNSFKGKIYFMRFSGLYNSIVGKKSWYRPEV